MMQPVRRVRRSLARCGAPRQCGVVWRVDLPFTPHPAPPHLPSHALHCVELFYHLLALRDSLGTGESGESEDELHVE